MLWRSFSRHFHYITSFFPQITILWHDFFNMLFSKDIFLWNNCDFSLEFSATQKAGNMKYLPEKFLFSFFVISICLGGSSEKIHRSLNNVREDSVKVWVLFVDKPMDGKNLRNEAQKTLSQRSLARREKAGISLDIHDASIDDRYVREIENRGGRLLRKSKWLNGASFIILSSMIRTIAGFDFVREIKPVARFKSPLPPRERPIDRSAPTDPFYGSSIVQNEMIGSNMLHERGFAGQGVLIGFLDSGFRTTHKAFDSLVVVAKYDFIHNDTIVDTEPEDEDFWGYDHGTKTLSCACAFLPGEIIGSAYRASVALAKTEHVAYERMVEEDNWVAGMEWLDSVGVDITSSSLGYSTFDDGTPYSLGDLDGNTALTTIASDIAASRGICVVNSAGNERQRAGWPRIIFPADGDSVLSVGAVDANRIIAYFSSPGPTSDGRIKPDLCAMGQGTVIINSNDTIGILSGSGTSYSCPLIAGLCASVKSANPSLSGYNLALAVRNSCDRKKAYDRDFPPGDSANNDYGWGIPHGIVSAGIHDGFFGRLIDFSTGFPLPTTTMNINYGSAMRTVVTDTFGIFIDPLADIGMVARVSVAGYASIENIPVSRMGRAIFLHRMGDYSGLQIFPNPATTQLTALAYDSPDARLSVWSSDGTLVFDARWNPNECVRFDWDLKNKNSKHISNGVYIVRLATHKEEIVRKIAVVR